MHKFFTQEQPKSLSQLDPRAIKYKDNSGWSRNTHVMGYKFKETPLSVISLLRHITADPLDSSKVYRLESSGSSISDEDFKKAIGDMDDAEGMYSIVEQFINDPISSEINPEDLPKLEERFRNARACFRQVLGICVNNNDADTIYDFAERLGKKFKREANNPVFFQEAVEFYSMAYYALCEIRLAYVVQTPNLLNLRDWRRKRTEVDGCYFKSEPQMTNFIEQASKSTLEPQNEFEVNLAAEIRQL